MPLESQFFPGTARHEVFVANYSPLKSRGGEQRKKLLFRMPLGPEQSLAGMPSWVGDAYNSVAKDDSLSDRVNMTPELKGMTVELYSTADIPHRSLLLTRCTIKGLHVTRTGVGDKATFALFFTAYTPNGLALHQWLNDHYEMSTFATFDVDQSALPLDEDADEEEDDPQDSLDLDDEEDHEAERREAVSPKHDHEFRSTPLVTRGKAKRGHHNA